MKLKFWGVRGSIPTPGKETVRYGGNTPCVEVRPDDNTLLILDAGTGIMHLGDELMERGKPVKAYLLISHTHWDHIQGFPFFYPAAFPENEIIIIGSDQNGTSLETVLSDQMRSTNFPLQFNELKAKISFIKIGEGSFNINDTLIETIYLNHPSYTLGYRITHGGKSIVYMSDNEPFKRKNSVSGFNKVEKPIMDLYSNVEGNPNSRITAFAENADIMIHDSMFTPSEYQKRELWGHSDYMFALKMAVGARVKKLLLFHHGPRHTDEIIDDIVLKCRDELRAKAHKPECIAAAEGMVIEL